LTASVVLCGAIAGCSHGGGRQPQPTYTAEEFYGTSWQFQDFAFKLEPEGRLLVKGLPAGTWRVRWNTLILMVGDSETRIPIEEGGLVFDGNPLKRVE
jgi:hypothetical protein